MLGIISDDAKTRRHWDGKFVSVVYAESTSAGEREKATARFEKAVNHTMRAPEFPRDDFMRRLARLTREDHIRYRDELKSSHRDDKVEPPVMPMFSPPMLLRLLAPYAKPALPEILQMLAPDDLLVSLGCQLLTQPGPWAVPAAYPLLALAKTERAFDYPNKLADALVALEPMAPVILDRLIDQLSDPDSRNRRAAAIILLPFRARATKAIPRLLTLLEDSAGDVRSRAASALGEIGKDNEEVTAAMFRHAHDQEWYVRGSVLTALTSLNAPVDQMIPLLIEALREDFGTPDWSVPGVAVNALAKYGPKARGAIPELRRLLERSRNESGDNTFTLSQRAQKALDAISQMNA